MRRVAYIWLTTFPIDRMRRVRHPAAQVPTDRPFALVLNGPRGMSITALNRVAMEGGVQAGQMLADARAVLPGLLTRPAEPERDRAALQQLALWLGRYGPRRNIDGHDGLWVDITGVAHLFGGEVALARDCISRLRRAGYHALLAIADTRSGACALARYGTMCEHVLIAATGDTQTALADIPVEGLQLTGDLVVLLRRLGLKRIGQLYGLPRAALARRFRDAAPKLAAGHKRGRALVKAAAYTGWAEALVMRLDQALGCLGEPVRGIKEPTVYRVQRIYPEPLISHDGILAALDDLAVQLCRDLAVKDQGASALRFSVYRADGTVVEVLVRTSRPARDAHHMVELFSVRLERVDAGLGIDAVALEAMRTEHLAREQIGLAAANHAGNTLGRSSPDILVDRLVNRLGRGAVTCLAAVESHIPERAQRQVPALDGFSHCKEEFIEANSKPLRPTFLLDPAEPVTVLAEVPDGPPARFTWRRVTRRVVGCEGPERIAPEWWRLLHTPFCEVSGAAHVASRAASQVASQASRHPHDAPAGDAANNDERAGDDQGGSWAILKPGWRIRDYYRIEDEYGGLYWIYRAGLYPSGPAAFSVSDDALPSWYLQGLF